MKIIIGMPSGDMVHKGFTICYGEMLYYCFINRIGLVPADIRATSIERGRNSIVRAALEANATHILWLDSDMRFPSDVLGTFLSHDKDIVGATYRQRRHPHAPAHTELPDPSDALMRQVARLPGGMLLVRTSVYEKLDLPWYRNPFVPGTEDITTQDYDFCDRARSLGMEVWMDYALSLRLRHLGEFEYAL
jgi:hypothetical protein